MHPLSHFNTVPLCTINEYLKKYIACGAQTQGVFICVIAWGERELVQALMLCCLSPEGKSMNL